MKQVIVSGTGMHVPDKVVTNFDLEKLMDTSDEWIQQRSGISERRYVVEGESGTDLAVEASKKAMRSAGCEAKDIEMVLVATLSPDHYFPGNSAILQDKLGMGTTPAMDIRCQCSGYIYALNVAKMFIQTEQYKRVLVVGAEVHSRALDFSDRGRDVAVLFGDGAGAMVLEASDDNERGFISAHLHAQGEHAKKLWVEAPTTTHTPYMTHDMVEEGKHYPQMDGKFVFKNAVARFPQVIGEALTANQLSADDVDHFFFHQANLRINEFVAKQLGVPAEKIHNNIQKYGNCSAASIPMCIDEVNRAEKIMPGQLICLAAFGSGFTWASALIRW